jgi:hypothetical protein
MGHLDWNMGYGVGVFENNALQMREIKVRSIVIQIRDLFRCNTGFSADGRTNVNSKWTADDGSDAKFSKPLQLMVNQVAAHLGSFHLNVSPENFWVMSGHLDRHDDAAKATPSKVINDLFKQPMKRAALVDRRTGNTGHQNLLISLTG